ncbi:cytochrome protein [Hypoxylon sp. FL1857]|nr:cytochrome protein [Hypoxylon sp. FL1857]
MVLSSLPSLIRIRQFIFTMVSDELFSVGQAVTAGLIACAGAFVYLLVKGYHARRTFYRLRQQEMPMPPWNSVLEHLLAVPPVMKTLPEDTQQPDAFEALCRANQKKDADSIIYLDMWPFAGPMMVICSPVLARSRALFNSGFSASYILQQTPHIVDSAQVYVDVLRDYARKGEMFSLDDATCWYMMDVIGAVTLDARLHSQRQFNPLASALRRQIRWHVLDNEWNLLIRWNPARPFVQRYNNEAAASSRSIIHLALASYMAQQKDKPRPKKLDSAFRDWATVQIRLFLFAGHDSTSSTICYCFYLLQSHPEAMAKLRAEHDAVFGTNITETANMMRERPHLLNQLPYTTAAIKESLRLFPPASAMRGGQPGVYLQDDKGNRYPTEGTNMWILHSAVQRNPKYWPSAMEFIPERWLAEPGDPLYPVKGGWRPFEHGPRNCLGQTLAMLDVKITLALTVREFDIKHAYDEWDRLHPTSKVKSVNGERAYQTQSGGAHPADGYPCRISLRKH